MSVIAESLIGHRSGPARAARAALLILGGSVFVAMLAQVSVRLPFTPVPVTGQTLAVLLVGAVLGPWRGAAAVALYLAEGAAGLPVFAEGKAGWTYLVLRDPLHASGGYLWGFVLAGFVSGWFARRGWDRAPRTAIAGMFLGNAVIYVTGLPWLASALSISAESALAFGLYPFVVGDVVKILIAAATLPTAWRFVVGFRGSGPKGREHP